MSYGAHSSTAQRAAFAVSAAACAGLFAWSLYDVAHPTWLGFWRAAHGGAATPPPRVPQIVVSGLGVTDRCQSCHAALTEPAATRRPQPLANHPGPMLALHTVEKTGCTPCHGGLGRGTRLGAAHGEGPHLEEPLLRGELVQASCARCHEARHAPRAPALRRGAELADRFACYGCHEGLPPGDVVGGPGSAPRGAVGPALTFASARTSPGWLLAWLLDPPKLQRGARMGAFGFSEAQAADVVAFLRTFHDRADLSSTTPLPKDEAVLDALYDQGQKVFRMARCVSCHAVNGVGGNIGVDLGRVGEKLSREALLAWLERPERFHPGTRMPRFRLASADRAALAYFLFEEMRDPEIADLLSASQGRWTELSRNAQAGRGEQLLRARGCLGCHALENAQSQRPVGPDLASFGRKSVERLPFPADHDGPRTRAAWTRAKLERPRAAGGETIMPSFALGPEDIEGLAVYMLAQIPPAPGPHRAGPLVAKAPSYPAGPVEQPMREMRCLVCHSIDGAGGTLAPDLSAVGSRLKRDWMRDFLLAPDTIRPHLIERMPHLYLGRDEAELLASYLDVACRRGDLPAPPDPALREQGARLYAEHRCSGCHILGEEGGSLGPNLNGAPVRLRPDWMVLQLLDPRAAGAREPRLGLTELEARALAAYLLGIAGP